ncbi:type VI secretion system (T6SS) effector Tae4 (amidase) [Paracidovorax citrulli]|nr:hypothetical protein CQB05_20425 [Paracidovorax citrulli]PVY64869.1 type VI secretion system (T6SS) effector Tae4 (amidase) [Paracidovorax citrulli]UMT85543.1 hypothetical protein FRC75_20455 [Paracidovorax citrulli]UMT90470.1 hypothetical protein FRC90_21985 [Paracidovorax citrulli]UMT94507.1 hypothetical protein FRC97_05590 [Paracidovorax citrulli]
MVLRAARPPCVPLNLEHQFSPQYTGADGMKRIESRKGIVFFKDFYGPGMQGDHIDLWNGWRLSSFSSIISVHTPFGSHHEKGAVWFWETV